MRLAMAAVAGSAATLAAVSTVTALRRRRRRTSGSSDRLGPLALPSNPFAAELLTATELALECGEAMRQCLNNKQVDWKDAAAIDPVTATDKENEARVTRVIQARFPTHQIIGEEAAAEAGKTPKLTKTPSWVVDPIDGTTNFVYGMKLSVVSLGFCVGGEPVAGVVYDPYADELFAAARGRGAFLNGRPISVDAVQTLSKAMVQFELGYVRDEDGLNRILGALRTMLRGGTRGMRTLGSCVLCLVWVACGRSSAYYTGVSTEGGHPWDYAAGAIIAQEAGASITDINGGGFNIESSSCICAASASLGDEIRATLANAGFSL